VSVGRLATVLDEELIAAHGGEIKPGTTPDTAMPLRSGAAVSAELGGRLLVRYMLRDQVGRFQYGTTDRTFVTPTPFSARDVGSYLALPNVRQPRKWAMLIDPKLVDEVQGPRRVRGGAGIEYWFPNGFPAEALTAVAWEIEVH
jgi:hypothetical protein